MKSYLFVLLAIYIIACDSGNDTGSAGFSQQGLTNGNLVTQYQQPAYDPNAYTNQAFGYSVPVLRDLKIVSNQQMNSITFLDATTESRSDIVIVMPSLDDIDVVTNRMDSGNVPYQKVEGGISFSMDVPGQINMRCVYASSPFNGGLIVMRMVTGQLTISDATINNLLTGIKFYEPQATLEQRNIMLAADAKNQKDINEQQALNELRRQRVFEHGMHELNSVGDN